MTARYVLVELTTEDWGAVDPATYVRLSMPNFMGTIDAIEVEPPDVFAQDADES